MDLGLLGRHVLVTGASGHIGRAIAVAFAAEGARVVVGYHARADGARETAAAVEARGGTAMLLRLDLSDGSSVASAADRLLAKFGGVDVLVNNAVAWPTPAPGELFEDAPLHRLRDSLEANLMGHYALTQALVGPMRSRGWGRIVHVSTGLVEDGFPGSAAYTTPKAALHGLTRTMSRELASAGILTNVVMAGFVPRPGTPQELIEQTSQAAAIGRTSTAEEVASAIVFLASCANTNITGELIRADGHFLAPA